MLKGSIKALIAKDRRQRLVRTMRGYRSLKQSGEISRLTALQNSLTVTELRSCIGRCSRLIFGAGVDNAELSIRQYLIVRVSAVTKLNGAVLHALGTPASSVNHYVPPDWQVIHQQHGFKVPSLWCGLAWFCGNSLLHLQRTYQHRANRMGHRLTNNAQIAIYSCKLCFL